MSVRLSTIAAVGRLYPFFSGNFRLVNYSRIAGVFSGYGSLAWCPSPGGPLLVPLDDAVCRCIYFTGDYDRKIAWLCRKLLRPGDTAIDVGANLGVITLAMAKFVGPFGRVHCFEPNPKMQNLLRQSIDRSHQNITLHKIALGAADAELELHIPPDNIGAGSFVSYRETPDAETVKCQVRRLADIIEAEGITDIRLVKIDVEGFENEVLLGSGDLLSSIRPIIILETNETSDKPFREYPAIATLIKNDYSFFAIPKALLSMRVSDIDLDQVSAPSHDIVAVPSKDYAHFGSLLG
jgi:FkbM family methyltransferase